MRADGVLLTLRAGAHAAARAALLAVLRCATGSSSSSPTRRSRRAASRTRAGSRPRCRRARLAGPGALERFARRRALAARATARCRSWPRRTTRPSALAELDRARDASLREPRRQPREPQPGPRPARRVRRGASAAPDCVALARAPRQGSPRHLAPVFGASLAALGRRPRRDAVACTCTRRARARLGGRAARAASARARARRLQRGLAPTLDAVLAHCAHLDVRPQTQTAPLIDLLRRATTACTRASSILTDGSPDVARPHARPRPRPRSHARAWEHPGRFAERDRSACARLRARARSPSGSAARSAAARPRSCSRCAGALRDRPAARRRDERHLHPRGRRVPDPPRGAAARADPRGRDGRLPARRDPRGHQPQPARARGARSTRSAPSCCSSRAAATTWRRSTAASSSTTRSTSSTSRAATRFRARAARASRSPICW